MQTIAKMHPAIKPMHIPVMSCSFFIWWFLSWLGLDFVFGLGDYDFVGSVPITNPEFKLRAIQVQLGFFGCGEVLV